MPINIFNKKMNNNIINKGANFYQCYAPPLPNKSSSFRFRIDETPPLLLPPLPQFPRIHYHQDNNIVKYYKIKRFFSPKSLTSSPTTTSVVKSGTHKAGNNNNNKTNRGIRGNNDVLRVDHGNGVISRSKIDSANNKMKNTCASEKGSFVNLMDWILHCQ
ncbi:Metabotropic glutamate receptor-like protein G [Bienertia sinuspersici]